jgi:hypothetical protein
VRTKCENWILEKNKIKYENWIRSYPLTRSESQGLAIIKNKYKQGMKKKL